MNLKLLLGLSFLLFAAADLPIHCLQEQIVGKWIFHLGAGDFSNNITCDKFTPLRDYQVVLSLPNIATDRDGNTGTWTMVYDEGFEVVIADRKFFAFSHYGGGKSQCDQTMPGWYHGIDGKHWGCYQGAKTAGMPGVSSVGPVRPPTTDDAEPFVVDHERVAYINGAQADWEAYAYPQFEGLSMGAMRKRTGHPLRGISRGARAQPEPLPNDLPEAWDWRSIEGKSYVSPVRDQGGCGSCYSFGATGALEARMRIRSELKVQTILSPQDIVSCDTKYSQACDGGFDYLVGKYGEDYGIVSNDDFPYSGSVQSCSKKAAHPKYVQHVTNYTHVGGYYGACSAAKMMQEIYTNGPVSISMEWSGDLMYYKSGIYRPVEGGLRVGKWEPTDHCVLIVGWGTKGSTKYWIVKNSWGTWWGDKGYFQVELGRDLHAIESMAISMEPVMA